MARLVLQKSWTSMLRPPEELRPGGRYRQSMPTGALVFPLSTVVGTLISFTEHLQAMFFSFS